MRLFVSMNEQGAFDILNSLEFNICGGKVTATHYELIFDENGILNRFERSLPTASDTYELLTLDEVVKMLPFHNRENKLNDLLK